MNILNLNNTDPNQLTFPDPRYADDEGILAIGGDLSPDRLIFAYSSGIFPWYGRNEPILWWSPNPRFVLKFEDFKTSKSLRKFIKKTDYKIKFNTNFEEVIRNCSIAKRKDQDDTWITDDMISAYLDLHKEGYAISCETYLNDELIGGLYGIAIGKMFAGESMFFKKDNASKFAFVNLVEKLRSLDFHFIDCQQETDLLASFGAKNIDRDTFLEMLQNSQL